MNNLDLYDYLHTRKPPWAQAGIMRRYAKTPYRKRETNFQYAMGYKKRPVKRPRYGFHSSETKFKDAELGITTITSSWATYNPTTLDSLTSVAQGSTESTHLGRTMYMVSLHLKGEFFYVASESQTAPIAGAVIRYVIVMDTDTKGAEVTATDVFDAGQTEDVFAFRNLQHTSRLKVFVDRSFVINPNNTNEGAVNVFANAAVRRTFKVNLKFKTPIRVLFKGLTAVVASVVDNSFHFLALSPAGAVISVQYQVRLRFKDTI